MTHSQINEKMRMLKDEQADCRRSLTQCRVEFRIRAAQQRLKEIREELSDLEFIRQMPEIEVGA